MSTLTGNESKLAKALDEAWEAGLGTLEIAQAILFAVADSHGMQREDEEWGHADRIAAKLINKRLREVA
jgi:hypothetical protein